MKIKETRPAAAMLMPATTAKCIPDFSLTRARLAEMTVQERHQEFPALRLRSATVP